MQIPRVAPGEPHPWSPQNHPYPTRFHGGIWRRPVFGMPRVPRPTQVFRPSQLTNGVTGLGTGLGAYVLRRPDGIIRPTQAAAGLGELQYDVGTGVFRYPWDDGGGVFNRAIDGPTGQIPEGTKIAYFLGAVALAGVATYYGLRKSKKFR